MDRREMFKNVLGIAAITTIGAKPTRLLGGEHVPKQEAELARLNGVITQGDGFPTPQSTNEVIKQEVSELIKYRRGLHIAAKKREAFCAPHEVRKDMTPVSMPFACLPPSYYTRLTQEQLALPEPRIPAIHDAMQHGWDYLPNLACRELTKRLNRVPRGIDLVDKLTLMDPTGRNLNPRDRIVSPKYIIDMDEGYFGMRTTAGWLVDAVDGIWVELQAKMDCARGTLEEARKRAETLDPGGKRGIFCQATNIKTFIKREAYMLDFMAWNSGTGWMR